MADFQATDFARIHLAYVLEQFDYLALELKLSRGLRRLSDPPIRTSHPGWSWARDRAPVRRFRSARIRSCQNLSAALRLRNGTRMAAGRVSTQVRARTTPFSRTLNLVHDCQIRRLCEWCVVSGRPLDAGRAELTRLQRGNAGGKLFRWTLAGRAKFLDDGLNCRELVEVPRLPGTAIFVCLPAVQIVLPIPFQSLAQRFLVHVENFSKAAVGVPSLLIERNVRSAQ